MARLLFRPSAKADLREITEYIEDTSPGRGFAFVDRIKETCTHYAENPLMGRDRSELSEGLRGFPLGNYIVLYRPLRDGIAVVRVVHAARDIRRLF